MDDLEIDDELPESDAELLLTPDPDGIAVITLNRPARRNALNRAVLLCLNEALHMAAQDPTVRGVIVTGAGGQAFAAGADIDELASLSPHEAQALSQLGQGVLRRVETLGKPTIAAVNGYALGGGLELAMACTLRFAAETAQFGMPEARLGLMPGFGGSQRLPRLVGRGRALDLLLSGERIDAAEAHRIGLADRVLPGEQLLDACRAYLRQVAMQGPLAVAAILQTVDMGLEMGLEQGLAFESAQFGVIRGTRDCQEGLTAFRQKRAPAFEGA